MESLIADFIQFSSAIAKFLFLQGRLGTRLCVHLISWLTKIFSFFKLFDNPWGNSYFQFVVIMI